MTVRVELPYHLRTLAEVGKEVVLELTPPATPRALVAALEAQYPTLHGTVIDPATGERRALLRFFTCGEDWSFAALDGELPEAVRQGREPFLIVGAISGG
jgi:hypothetical protein